MKFSKKVLTAILSIVMLSSVGTERIHVAKALTVSEISDISQKSEVPDYTLVKVLKYGNDIILQYRHNKTGAQIVATTRKPTEESAEAPHKRFIITYKVPSENNKGTVHVLEHCLVSPILSKTEDINGETNYLCMSLIVEESTDDFFDLFRSEIHQVKDPDFMHNKEIFEREAHYTVNKRGKTFIRGRVFKEQSGTTYDKKNRFMKNDSKCKFDSGGLPQDILTLKYEEVCDTYSKYIHPSNSLVQISGTPEDCKHMMRELDQEYFKHYNEKKIDVNYNLDSNSYSSIPNFSSHIVSDDTLSSRYKANIGYALNSLTDKEQDLFRAKCEIINNMPIPEGYTNIDAHIANDGTFPYLEVSVFGDNPEQFEKEALQKNIHDFLSSSGTCMPSSYKPIESNPNLYRDCILVCNEKASFAVYNDPFSEMMFTIKDNELYSEDLRKVKIDHDSFLKQINTPQEIMVFQKGKDEEKQPLFDVKRKINMDISEDPIANKVFYEVICDYILTPNLTTKGVLYNKISRYHFKEKCFCFEGNQNTIDDLTDFFDHDFTEIAKTFKLTPDMLSKVKSKLKNSLSNDSEKKRLESLTCDNIQSYINKLTISNY